MTGFVRPRGSRLASPQPLLAGLLISVFCFAPVRAATASLAEQAQALVERAVAQIQAVGSAQAFADFSHPDGAFVDGELYVFCQSADGRVLANGANPKLVGRNLLNLRNAEGRLPIAEISRVGLTQGQGWVEYLWPNPQTHRVQHKIAYVVRIDDRTVCGSGFYKPDQP
jgi:cytochrome c